MPRRDAGSDLAIPRGRYTSHVIALDAAEIDLVGGGGLFESIGWAFDNPGTAMGRAADRFVAWYRINPATEDPNWFID